MVVEKGGVLIFHLEKVFGEIKKTAGYATAALEGFEKEQLLGQIASVTN